MEDIIVSFVPGQCRILGIFGKEIHLIGCLEIQPNVELLDCVIILQKKEFLRCQELWFKGKKQYCESYDEYCGIMGFLDAQDYIEVESITLNVPNDDESEYTKVLTRTFRVLKFDNDCYFEHG